MLARVVEASASHVSAAVVEYGKRATIMARRREDTNGREGRRGEVSRVVSESLPWTDMSGQRMLVRTIYKSNFHMGLRQLCLCHAYSH